MQRITNCVLSNKDQVLLLQKPSRNWWVAPGGKMEPGESIKQSAEREFREETGLDLTDATLRAIFTVVIVEGEQPVNEWMMFTFSATHSTGQMLEQSPEGLLEWKNKRDVRQLPMAEGDKFLFDHVLHHEGLMYGTVYYTPDYQLISYTLDPKR